MVDVVSPEVRSRMMAGIRGINTKPELLLRRGLHCAGFRYRLHDRALPGKPDMVFPRRHAVLFAHGCFWHGHDCHLFKWPATRQEFWRTKIGRNREVDARTDAALKVAGWRRGTVWECALRGKYRMAPSEVFEQLTKWLQSDRETIELSERQAGGAQ
jgi:DNA mismatch endonuclease (patch repair protein)